MNAQALPPPEVLAKAHLLGYAGLQWPGYDVARVHRIIAGYLMAVERGEIMRLMIEVPPQYGKTQLVEFLMAFHLGRQPLHELIYCTYAQERADDVGRHVRNLIRDPVHKMVFGQGLAGESTAAHRFSVTTREDGQAEGGAFFVGRGGAVTGRGGDGLVIDDPIKNREEADSIAVQRSLRDFYSSVLLTRLRPWSFIIFIMTRWAVNDLAGYIKKTYPEEKWVTLRLPGLAECKNVDGSPCPDPLGRQVGDALWPERYPAKYLRHMRDNMMLPRDWLAMVQQRPTLSEGFHFKREWFDNRYDKLPEYLHMYGASDMAVKGAGGDSTELCAFGVDPSFDIYIADWWHGQVTMDRWIAAMLDMVIAKRPLAWFSESGVIRRAAEPYIMRAMHEKGAFTRLEWLPRTGDKVAMARAIIGRAAAGKVHFPRAAWADRVINQLCSFTGSNQEEDDCVDTMAHIGMGLDQMSGAIKPGPEGTAGSLKPFSQAWLNYEEKPRGDRSKW